MSDLLLTGLPRSGTTLACRLLNDRPDTVALAEGMGTDRLSQDRAEALAQIARHLCRARESLLRDGRAPAVTVDGAAIDNFFPAAAADGRRQRLAHPGELVLDRPPASGFALVLKQNAAFTALLPELGGRWPVVALVRHPLALLASWQTVDLPVGQGRLPMGEHFDPGLAAALDAQPDPLLRQVLILDWFVARYLDHLPPARIVRYEDLVASSGRALYRALGIAGPLAALQDRNASTLYRPLDMPRLLAALEHSQGRWSRWYGAEETGGLMHRMQGNG